MKNPLKKILSILGIVVVALIVLAAVLFTVFGNKAIKVGIESGGTMAMKTPVSVQSVNLSLLGGTFEMTGLDIKNPSGYKHPDFVKLGKASVALNIKSLMSDTIEIKRVQLDNIQLTLEQKTLTQNNLHEILNNLPKSEPGTTPAPETKTEAPGKKVVIKELVINGVEVSAKLLPIPGKADTVTIKLDPIVMNDLGDKPINAAELTSKILKAIANGIAKQGKDLLPLDMVDSIGKDAMEAGKQVLETGQKALEGVGEAGKGIMKGAGDVGKKAGDAIKGIFQKKE
jgi:hypothetical protein